VALTLGLALLAFATAGAALGAAGCKGNVKLTAKKVSYSATAKQNYKKGAEALKDKSFEDATKYFKFVRSRYPFSKYATLAELRLADVLRDSEKFIAAIDAYKTFVKEHPTHPQVEDGYAAYQIGYCYWKLTPSDFFILPPANEKDQTSTEAAMLAFKRFLKRYPDSKHRKKAKKYYHKALRQLAAHELYVARFYLKKDKPKGAIFRLETLIERYPDAGYEPEVMLMLGRTYLQMKKPEKARTVFRRLIKEHPGNYNAKKAKRYLTFISKTFGLQ
jgi:outer membrane protein assembly factor BamD